MSELNITEYVNLGRDLSGVLVPVGEEPALVIQNVSFTGTSVQSSAFNDKTRFVRLIADIDTRIEFGINPTAGATKTNLPMGVAEYFGVKLGESLKVAAIQL